MNRRNCLFSLLLRLLTLLWCTDALALNQEFDRDLVKSHRYDSQYANWNSECSTCFTILMDKAEELKKQSVHAILQANRLVESVTTKISHGDDRANQEDLFSIPRLEDELNILGSLILTNKLTGDRLNLLGNHLDTIRRDSTRLKEVNSSLRSLHSRLSERHRSLARNIQTWSTILQQLSTTSTGIFYSATTARDILNSSCITDRQLDRSLTSLMSVELPGTNNSITSKYADSVADKCSAIGHSRRNSSSTGNLVDSYNHCSARTPSSVYASLLSFASQLQTSILDLNQFREKFEKNKLKFLNQEQTINFIRQELDSVMVSRAALQSSFCILSS